MRLEGGSEPTKLSISSFKKIWVWVCFLWRFFRRMVVPYPQIVINTLVQTDRQTQTHPVTLVYVTAYTYIVKNPDIQIDIN